MECILCLVDSEGGHRNLIGLMWGRGGVAMMWLEYKSVVKLWIKERVKELRVSRRGNPGFASGWFSQRVKRLYERPCKPRSCFRNFQYNLLLFSFFFRI